MALGLLAGQIASPIAGGILGNVLSKGDREAANAAIRRAQEIIGAVDIPSPEALQVVLEKLQQQGELTPELEQALTQQVSQLQGWEESPELKSAQREALESLRQQGRTGLTMEDRAALSDIQRRINAEQRGAQGAILQNMQSRGMLGSGAELAARLSAAQGGAELASQQGMDIASQAQQRALQALAQSGSLAGSQQQAEFQRAAAIAQAADAINRFNTENQQATQARNIAARNAAQSANLGEKQRVADTNVGLGNQQQMHNKQILVDDYNRRLQKAMAQAGIETEHVARRADEAADRTAAMWAGIGNAAGQGFGAMNSAGAGGASKAASPYQQMTDNPRFNKR